jgi:hypothetical protein
MKEKKETPEERLKTRALDAYKKQKSDMDTLGLERTKANEYFLGSPRPDDVKGRSKVVSRDVFEIILWQLTDFVRIFLSGNQVVECRPQGPEDADIAELMEDKANFDFLKSNQGFKILYQFAFDALLNKLGCVKYFWNRYYEYKFHKYYDVPESYYVDLKAQKIAGLENPKELKEKHVFDKVEKVSEMLVDPMTGMPVQEATYNIKCRERIRKSHPVIVNVPPEEISYDINMKDRSDPEHVIIHRMKIHKRKLKKYGFTEDDVAEQVEKFTNQDTETQSRFADIGGLSFLMDEKDSDFVYLNECYLYDFDEDGNPIPKIVPIVGDQCGTIQDNEYGVPNFAFITPFMLAHRLLGLSSFNMGSDIQDVQTAFLRIILDHGYYQNNGVSVINQYRVNMSGLNDGKKPGLNLTMKYDVSPNDCIASLPSNSLDSSITNTYSKLMPMVKGARTGVTQFSQGLDPKAIANRTSGGVSQQMSASQGPRELIFRIFAETGVKDLFQGIVDMNMDFFDMEQAIQINGKWQTIDPGRLQGRGKIDVSIDVGIGTGTKREQFNNIMSMMQAYAGAAKVLGPMMPQVAGIEELKNMFRKSWTLVGFKNTDEFVLPKGQGGVIGNPVGAGINPENREGQPIQNAPG